MVKQKEKEFKYPKSVRDFMRVQQANYRARKKLSKKEEARA